MRLDRLKAFALSLPRATVAAQWGSLVFKVAGKVFFLIGLDGDLMDGVVFKCSPAEFDELTAIEGIGQAPYFARRMWVRVDDPAVLAETDLQARIRRSYSLVVARLPKKMQAALAGK
ncbi:MAG TPA: MmcQ/YjbR family DNA-binding protein [Lacunisphaera sp.]|nr:MmcQ/YjbR family DNA-binding protein [Lacunisphaera sp.]